MPYLNQTAVYEAYRFDEPWNGPNNSRLADKIGSIYLRSGLDAMTRQTTSFVAVLGAETVWPGAEAIRLDQIVDGTSNTLLVVEVPDGEIPWMAPADLQIDTMSFRINDGSGRGLGSRFGGSRIVTVDGMVKTLPDTLPSEGLRALLTRHGGEPVDWDRLIPKAE